MPLPDIPELTQSVVYYSTISKPFDEETAAPSKGLKVSFLQTEEKVEEVKVSFARDDDASTVKTSPTLPMARSDAKFFTDARNDFQNIIAKKDSAFKGDTNQVTALGDFWRWFFKTVIYHQMGSTNYLNLTRGAQVFLPFLSPYESYILTRYIEELDKGNFKTKETWEALSRCFDNRNVSRILMQNFASRFDIFWHFHHQLKRSRFFELIGQFPFLGFAAFPGTENFPGSRDHALNAIIRSLLPGRWITRFLADGTQGSVVLDPNAPVQNLAAEVTGLEVGFRNQIGNYCGRLATNKFRLEHRLPTDESVLRTFVTSPASTMINNGVEHVLAVVEKHWKNMMYQTNGNFAHQRMELLNPFETMRFHLPVVLTVLMNLRGRNLFDVKVVAPLVKELQELRADTIAVVSKNDVEQPRDSTPIFQIRVACSHAKLLLDRFLKPQDDVDVLANVCAQLESRYKPLKGWLQTVRASITEMEREARLLYDFISTVDVGIAMGSTLLQKVDWSVPKTRDLKNEIIEHLEGHTRHPTAYRALRQLSGKDKRTLEQLVKDRILSTNQSPLVELLDRAVTLLKREKRRQRINDELIKMSKGPQLLGPPQARRWYWMSMKGTEKVYYCERSRSDSIYLRDVQTGTSLKVSRREVSILEYRPIAEAISRAQKVFMTIEQDFLKRFSYEAFMELGNASSNSPGKNDALRSKMLNLIAVAQTHCELIDDARRNILSEIMLNNKKNGTSADPQSLIIIGGGPTGMMATLQCLQNVLASGGELLLHQKRNADGAWASSFERSQIVRLDARIISLLRFQLGTSFEDTFIPADGETEAHLGNTLPTQAFVEINIKRLEDILELEIVSLSSRGLMKYYHDSEVKIDIENCRLTKQGRHLKHGEEIIDSDGQVHKVLALSFISDKPVTKAQLKVGRDFSAFSDNGEVCRYRLKAKDANGWYRVDKLSSEDEVDLRASAASTVGPPQVDIAKLKVGEDYLVASETGGKLYPYRLREIDELGWHHFQNLSLDGRHFSCARENLPLIHPKDSDQVANGLVFESKDGSIMINYGMKTTEYELDISKSHVLLATGKLKSNENHVHLTTDEPYMVCCIEGIKISMGLHNFGARRFGHGVWDDFRSLSESNTRLLGDFTKTLRVKTIVDIMVEKVASTAAWRETFRNSLLGSDWAMEPFCMALKMMSQIDFHRKRLQIRFFELGDTYYIGMELPREYDAWKQKTLREQLSNQGLRRDMERLLDRLWIESSTDAVAQGDVFLAGGFAKIPEIHTIDSPTEQRLGSLERFDSFTFPSGDYQVVSHSHKGCSIRLAQGGLELSVPNDTRVVAKGGDDSLSRPISFVQEGTSFRIMDSFEIMLPGKTTTLIRSQGGHVSELSHQALVLRISDLAKGPNGNVSKVAVASFPVGHYICEKTTYRRPNSKYIFAYAGDAQSSPHFMRYSGLTGACINAVSLNNLIAELSIEEDESELPPHARYFVETSWSSGEVIERGTGANYGEVGLVRPGIEHTELVKFLHGRCEEQRDNGIRDEDILSRDWKSKLAASLVPRGMETDKEFLKETCTQVARVVAEKFGVLDETQLSTRLMLSLKLVRGPTPAPAGETDMASKIMDLVGRIILHSQQLSLQKARISSELHNQPKPVESVYDDFAVEAQNFANGLTLSTSLAAAALALRLLSDSLANTVSALLGIFSISVAFGTITNASRFRNRNEEARRLFYEEKLETVQEDVFSQLPVAQRQKNDAKNPFKIHLDSSKEAFVKSTKYYDEHPSKVQSFQEAYSRMDMSDTSSIDRFVQRLRTEFIPITFQRNSYLQEQLVRMYKASIRILRLNNTFTGVEKATEIHNQLPGFEASLKESLHRGPIKHGFVRSELKLSQRALVVALQRLLWIPTQASRRTKQLWRSLESAGKDEVPGLKRAALYVRELHFATSESQIAAQIILSASIVFLSGLLFTIIRVISFLRPSDPITEQPSETWVRVLVDTTAWAVTGSILGATLAAAHFVRKLRHLLKLEVRLRRGQTSSSIRKVQAATRWQILLTIFRLLANLGACVALPWSAYQGTRGSVRVFEDIPDDMPLYVAAGSLGMAVLAAVLFFFVELFVRYNLDPKLGKAIFDLFRGEIKSMYKDQLEGLLLANNLGRLRGTGSPTEQLLKANETLQLGEDSIEEQAWELTARRFLSSDYYRFDTVFAADRFGSIFHYLHRYGRPIQPDA